jgi:hypothetical protein
MGEGRRGNLDEDQKPKEMKPSPGKAASDSAMWQMPQRQIGRSAMLPLGAQDGLEQRNSKRTATMTRPLTKAQLSRLATPVGQQRQQDPFVRFLIRNLAVGAGIGIGIATLILATNTFGLLTLISGQSDAIAIAASFVVGGVMFFTPLTLAVAVGCAGRVK